MTTSWSAFTSITFSLDGDIGQLPDIFLVQLHGLCSGDHIVGHVAVAAPGDEGTPVDVEVAGVEGGAPEGVIMQDQLRKCGEGEISLVLMVHHPVLVSGHQPGGGGGNQKI